MQPTAMWRHLYQWHMGGLGSVEHVQCGTMSNWLQDSGSHNCNPCQQLWCSRIGTFSGVFGVRRPKAKRRTNMRQELFLWRLDALERVFLLVLWHKASLAPNRRICSWSVRSTLRWSHGREDAVQSRHQRNYATRMWGSPREQGLRDGCMDSMGCVQCDVWRRSPKEVTLRRAVAGQNRTPLQRGLGTDTELQLTALSDDAVHRLQVESVGGLGHVRHWWRPALPQAPHPRAWQLLWKNLHSRGFYADFKLHQRQSPYNVLLLDGVDIL